MARCARTAGRGQERRSGRGPRVHGRRPGWRRAPRPRPRTAGSRARARTRPRMPPGTHGQPQCGRAKETGPGAYLDVAEVGLHERRVPLREGGGQRERRRLGVLGLLGPGRPLPQAQQPGRTALVQPRQRQPCHGRASGAVRRGCVCIYICAVTPHAYDNAPVSAASTSLRTTWTRSLAARLLSRLVSASGTSGAPRPSASRHRASARSPADAIHARAAPKGSSQWRNRGAPREIWPRRCCGATIIVACAA
jgi:hypothetical protein